MLVNEETEDEKRTRLAEEMVKNLYEIAKLQSRTIPSMKLGKNGVFYIVERHKPESQ